MMKRNTATFNRLNRLSKKILGDFLTEHLPTNIFLVDTQGYVCWANQRLLKLINCASLESAQGLHISTWGEIRWDYIYEVMVNQKETSHEENFGDRYFSTIRKPIFDEKNNMLGILGISLDITDRKKSEIAKDTFLDNIRHDIRTPVSGLIGLSSILQDSMHTLTQDGRDTILKAITNTSQALLNLLDRVFESIQISGQEIPIIQNDFSLEYALQDVYKLHEAKALEKELVLKFYYDPHLPKKVLGEKLRIQKIVWELLTNALKYTETGSVELSAYLLDQTKENITVKIQVKDTGLGIPADKQTVIFEQFTRLTPSWAQSTQGQGIGLFNVTQLVKDIGAQIQVESTPNIGSTFICKIPLRYTVDECQKL